MNNSNLSWVSMWGNAMSISENRPESYGKNITLQYRIYCPFTGDKLRISYDNYCGLDEVHITTTTVCHKHVFYPVTFAGNTGAAMPAGAGITSDPVDMPVKEGDFITVNFYLEGLTELRSSVYACGPLSEGRYCIGDMTECEEPSINTSRKTNTYYFLNNISIYTAGENHALVCYGDSITAQDWPDYLQLRVKELGIHNLSIIRRATSGSRILRQYDNITYESYGLKGSNRFMHEVPTDGADAVLIQQGINDIIHPVGTDINPFRPMSDLPTIDELWDGMKYYIDCARSLNYKVYVGTLLPIEGWRTYADFREILKNEFNDRIRTTALTDGCVDFDKAVRNKDNPKAFAPGLDSGDHLHPSKAGYKQMAGAVPEYILRS